MKTPNLQRASQTRRQVFRRIRDEIARMQGQGDMDRLLNAMRQGLLELDVRFDHCGVNLVEEGPPPQVTAYTLEASGDWRHRHCQPPAVAFLMDVWRRGQTAYRPDLQRHDTHGETSWLHHSLRSIVDVPFQQGTLALSSREPDAFTDDDLELLEDMAHILGDGLLRLDDLNVLARRAAELEQRNQALEGEVAARRRNEQIQRQRLRVLELLATGAPLDKILESLITIAETANPDVFGSVLLVDPEARRLRHGAAPKLPDFFNQTVDGLVYGPGIGSCGNTAHSGQRTIAEDIQTHAFWTQYRDLAAKAGLGACWSEPIIAPDGTVLGTFAMYFAQPRHPSDEDLEFSRELAHLGGIAIAHHQAAEALRVSHRHQAERLALQQLRNQVWEMASEADIEKVMTAVMEIMRGFDIPFDSASINVIDDIAQPSKVRYHLYLGSAKGGGQWQKTAADSGLELILDFWRRPKPTYRPDLRRHDPYAEGPDVSKLLDYEVRSIIDVPFSHGTLAFNSARPDPYSDSDVAFMRDLADILSGGFRRLQDIKTLHRQEAALRQAQKMEAIGELTAGVAHNFNNMLQGILGNIVLARQDAPDDIRPLLENAEQVVQSAADMVRQLMVFSRQGLRPAKEAVDIATLVQRVADICLKTFDRKIELRLQLPPHLPPVLGAAAQLEQALLNLCLNARDALEGLKDRLPYLSIEAEVQNPPRLPDSAPPDAPDGPYVCLSLSDNGSGMDEKTRQRVFDPFFTTKEGGTGLGLSTVFGIVADNGGWIECDSTPHIGTRFSIFLPASVHSQSPPAPQATRPAELPHGTETLLVIDDEESVRNPVALLFERLGYTVHKATDGQEGLQVYRQDPDAIDLILLDLSMPRMSGTEVLKAIQGTGHSVKVMLFTGHAPDQRPAGVDDLIAKPFSLIELSRRVRKLLDG